MRFVMSLSLGSNVLIILIFKGEIFCVVFFCVESGCSRFRFSYTIFWVVFVGNIIKWIYVFFGMC